MVGVVIDMGRWAWAGIGRWKEWAERGGWCDVELMGDLIKFFRFESGPGFGCCGGKKGLFWGVGADEDSK